MPKIMIVEDDSQLRNQLKEVLQSYNYEVYAIETFCTVEEQFVAIEPHLVLLDINLPYYDGNYYCRMFRKHSNLQLHTQQIRFLRSNASFGLSFRSGIVSAVYTIYIRFEFRNYLLS